MAGKQSDRVAVGQPDGLDGFSSPVRQYAIASIVVVLAALLAINFIAERIERRSVEARLEAEAVSPARVGGFRVVEQISALSDPAADSLLAIPEDVAVTDRIVLNAFAGQPVNRVDIVDPAGFLLYSTDHTEIGTPSGLTDYIDTGDSRYMSHEVMGAMGNEVRETVITSVPVFKEGPGGASAPPEVSVVVYRDVTEAIDAATQASGRFRLLTLIAVMAALFAGLMFVVVRGHKIAAKARRRLHTLLQSEKALSSELDTRNDELEAAINAKNTLLSVVTHELNNPIASVTSLADVLRRNRSGKLTDREIEMAKAINRGAKQMGLLVSDLLDYSRGESGTMTLSAEVMDVRALVGDATRLSEPVFAEKSQELSVSCAGEPLLAEVDPARVTQVLSNLLSNASKYSPEGAEISVTCEAVDGHLRVAVADSGIGISEEDQQNLFTPFFRARNEETMREKGTGLGLMISRQITELHGGTLTLESKRDEGTTITMSLPEVPSASASGEGRVVEAA